MKLSRLIVPKGLLLAVLACPGLLMPAFAQQEVDPTWYDPWAAAPKAVHLQQARANQKRTTRKLRVANVRAKENRQTQVRAYVSDQTQKSASQLALK